MEYSTTEPPTKPKWLSDMEGCSMYFDPKHTEYHSAQLYRGLVEKFKDEIKRFIDCGGHSAVFEMNDGNVLKFSYMPLKSNHGKRPFDLPILKHGEEKIKVSGKKRTAYWHIQPKVRVCRSKTSSSKFEKSLEKFDYFSADPGPQQLGWYKGELKVIDYPSVWNDPWAKKD
jgi:hypothetical protein